jgi:hypothetical protein
VLILPVYRESPDLLARLARSLGGGRQVLVIALLNRPEQDSDERANSPMRQAVAALPAGARGCRQLAPGCDLFCHDLEALCGPTPKKQGVGLVRKIGCDIALQWMAAGAIESEWLCCSDADATLPEDYFARLASVPQASGAAAFPFEHLPGPDRHCNAATALYELRLLHYVLGLDHAASPYAYHTLGSTLAVRAGCYARVHGFPRRSGGEDFYLLNKVNKLGPVTRLGGEAIGIRSRYSRRVPFGTGPAVAAIVDAGDPGHQARFYHPMCFEALRVFLSAVPALREREASDLCDLLSDRGLERSQAGILATALQRMGVNEAIAHCRDHGQTPERFMRHFHQWFDAFRTLKCIHALRDALWPDQSLPSLDSLKPRLWPCADGSEIGVDALRAAIRGHWNWISARRPDDW